MYLLKTLKGAYKVTIGCGMQQQANISISTAPTVHFEVLVVSSMKIMLINRSASYRFYITCRCFALDLGQHSEA